MPPFQALLWNHELVTEICQISIMVNTKPVLLSTRQWHVIFGMTDRNEDIYVCLSWQTFIRIYEQKLGVIGWKCTGIRLIGGFLRKREQSNNYHLVACYTSVFVPHKQIDNLQMPLFEIRLHFTYFATCQISYHVQIWNLFDQAQIGSFESEKSYLQ